MRWLHDVIFRIRALGRSEAMESEMNEEMAFHLDMETKKLEAAGHPPEEARRLAEKHFGNMPRQREGNREAMGITVVSEMIGDVRYGLRQLVRNPGFALAGVLTLALGIGANTAIFTIADRALLRKPPVESPDRLAMVYTTCRRGFERCSSSYPDYQDYRDRSRTLADLAGFSGVPLVIGEGENLRAAAGQLVTGNFFSLLGAPMHLGRAILPADDVRDGAAPVAVLQYDFWEQAFGADSAMIGNAIRINGAPFTVVGVAGREFRGLQLNQRPVMWMPLLAGPQLGESVGAASNPDGFDARGNRWIGALVGRMSDGVPVRAVQTEMVEMAQWMAEDFPDARAAADGFRGITVDPVDGYVLPVAASEDLKGFLYLLLGVVAVTLLLAATNLANLLLARASARGREVGMRLAVGASRGRLVRQLLTESLTLAAVGGVAGLLVAVVMLRSLSAFELPGGVVIGELGGGSGLDARVLGFTALVTVVTALLFGLAPALRATSSNLTSAVKGEISGRRGGEYARVRKALVGLQVALCLVLLVGAGLFLRTLNNTLNSDLGFEPAGLLSARFNMGVAADSPEQSSFIIRDLLDRTAGVPGVTASAVATLVPFQGGGFRGTFAEIPDYVPAPDEEIRFDFLTVTPGYFDAVGARHLDGRLFQRTDVEGGMPVAVLNRLAAERYWGTTSDAVGRRLNIGGSNEVEVVGVIDDLTWSQVGEEVTPFVFLSLHQFPSIGSSGFMSIVARVDGNEASLVPAVRSQVQAALPGLPAPQFNTGSTMLQNVMMTQRMGTTLLLLFGGVALILAVVGIYGVVGYTVARRSREIGIRMAVGANGANIVCTVLMDMLVPVGVGLIAGIIATRLFGSSVAAFMYQVEPGDPVTVIAVAVVLIAAAGLATLLPARRAAAEDPVKVLMTD